ncbi:MAG TPA: FliM/FliN family flagellar motor switch protein [bacterium]|nr:FliM/FliN family flagellar motor switch protein [bacterium]
MDDVSKKDPYLSELDAMDNFEPPPPDLGEGGEETVHETEEPTRIDLKAPQVPKQGRAADPGAQPVPEVAADVAEMMEAIPEGEPPVKELLDLAPDMTVPLVIVMGRKSFTVKDLLALRIGQVMDLERSPAEPVDLVAAGKVVGKGELVEVDGKLGIRVLKLLK